YVVPLFSLTGVHICSRADCERMASEYSALSHFAMSMTVVTNAPLGRSATQSSAFSSLPSFQSYPLARSGTVSDVVAVAVIWAGAKTRSLMNAFHGLPLALWMISASM